MDDPEMLIFTGSMLILAALWLAVRSLLFVKRSQKTLGQVTSYTDKSDNTPKFYRLGLKASFQDSSGKVFSAESFFSINANRYPIGSTVSIRYNPGKPQEAHIGNLLDLFGIELIFSIIGGIILYVGISGL